MKSKTLSPLFPPYLISIKDANKFVSGDTTARVTVELPGDVVDVTGLACFSFFDGKRKSTRVRRFN